MPPPTLHSSMLAMTCPLPALVATPGWPQLKQKHLEEKEDNIGTAPGRDSVAPLTGSEESEQDHEPVEVHMEAHCSSWLPCPCQVTSSHTSPDPPCVRNMMSASRKKRNHQAGCWVVSGAGESMQMVNQSTMLLQLVCTGVESLRARYSLSNWSLWAMQSEAISFPTKSNKSCNRTIFSASLSVSASLTKHLWLSSLSPWLQRYNWL